MALDFPASPSVNQTYSGPGGVIWVWDGAKWVSGTGSTVYAPVTSPVFLGNPTAPNPPAGDADTSVATTSFVAAAVAPAFNGTGRNLLHNPLFNIAQRGAGPFTAPAGGFTLDRWIISFASDTISVSQFTISDFGRSQIGDEAASFALASTFTGSAAAAAYSYETQKIENVRRLSNKTVTVSFWALGSAALKLGVNLYQGFGTGGSPSATVILNGQSVTLSATTFTRYSLTFTLPSIAGMTLGTNNDHATWLNFWFSCGATNAALSGNVGVQSGTVYLWGVQLEIGSVATPLEKPDPRYDLANCQRFYQVGNYQIALYHGIAGSGISMQFMFPTPMRATPSMVPTYGAQANCSGSNAIPINAGAYQAGTTVTAVGNFNLAASFTASADL